MKFLNSLQPLALVLMRVALGIIFLYHGYPKLIRGASMQPFFVEHGLPAQLVFVAGVLEVFGGVLLILGLFTQISGLLLAGEMAVAIWKVHSDRGIMAVREYELPLAVAVGCFVLATVGAGAISVDEAFLGSGGGKRSRSSKSSSR